MAENSATMIAGITASRLNSGDDADMQPGAGETAPPLDPERHDAAGDDGAQQQQQRPDPSVSSRLTVSAIVAERGLAVSAP